MPKKYDEQLRERVVRLCMTGHSCKAISDKYGISRATVNRWKKEATGAFKGSDESGKERIFLEKSRNRPFEDRQAVYEFIDQNAETLGMRWMFQRLGVNPNAFYTWRRGHKQSARESKRALAEKEIQKIYDQFSGNIGYRKMTDQLAARGMRLSPQTVPAYMRGLCLKTSFRGRPAKPANRIAEILGEHYNGSEVILDSF